MENRVQQRWQPCTSEERTRFTAWVEFRPSLPWLLVRRVLPPSQYRRTWQCLCGRGQAPAFRPCRIDCLRSVQVMTREPEYFLKNMKNYGQLYLGKPAVQKVFPCSSAGPVGG